MALNTSQMLTDSGLSRKNTVDNAIKNAMQTAAQKTANAFNNYISNLQQPTSSGSSGVSGVLAARDEIINNLKGSSGGGSGTKASTAKASSGSSYSGGGDYSSAISSGPSILDLLRQNYNAAVGDVNARYDLQDQNINSQNEDALRQAYINYMMSRKNADADMARQGYTGGLTESNKARMYNNYGNVRADLLKQRAQQLEEQRVKRNAELIQLLSNFNNQQARYLY